MPSKKERIDYLEVQVAGLIDKLTETIGELEELKKKVGNAWLIPTTNPITVPSTWPESNTGYCPTCGQYYWGSHVCSGPPWKITWSTVSDTTQLKVNGETGTIVVKGPDKK